MLTPVSSHIHALQYPCISYRVYKNRATSVPDPKCFNMDPTLFFRDFKMVKSGFFFVYFCFLGTILRNVGKCASVLFNLKTVVTYRLLAVRIKFQRKMRIRILIVQIIKDPDPGGLKINKSCVSAPGTLSATRSH